MCTYIYFRMHALQEKKVHIDKREMSCCGCSYYKYVQYIYIYIYVCVYFDSGICVYFKGRSNFTLKCVETKINEQLSE